MLFEILSTASMGLVAGSAYYYQNKSATNDHDKIKKIADAANLKTSEGGIQIYRKNKNKHYTEYVYKIPLGLSFKEFEEKKHVFIDGLNNKSESNVNLENLKKINWKGDIIRQLRDIFNNRVQLDKHLEMEYDGMLKFRVYDQGLQEKYVLSKEILSKCKPWTVPLGMTLGEQVAHDFESQSGAHILLGGATDMGKSTVLNVILISLLHNHPDDVEFTLIDLKGGLELGPYESLKQVKRFASDLESAEKALKQTKDEMESIFNFLKKKGKKSVKQAGIKKRHFVIIDEAAELASEGETDREVKKQKVRCENYIKDISRRGRASGMKLLYSTQNPTSEVIGSQIKRNLVTRIALPVDTSTASTVILDEGGAEKLPLIAGRSIYKRHRSKVMQAYFIEESFINEVIKPHINIRAKEDNNVADVDQPTRKDSFIIKAI